MIFAKIIMASGMAVGFLWMILGIFATIIGEAKDFFETMNFRMFLGIWFLAFIVCLIWLPIIGTFL